MTWLAPVAPYFVALTPRTGFRVWPPLTFLQRTESLKFLCPVPAVMLLAMDSPYVSRPTCKGSQPNANRDSPSWGSLPQGHWQDWATLP